MEQTKYAPDKPEDCRYCFFWKNRKKEILCTTLIRKYIYRSGVVETAT